MSVAHVLRDALLTRAAEEAGRSIVAPAARPCWHCHAPTVYLDLYFETPLHPGSCTRAKDDDYERALARRPEGDR